MTKPKQPKPRKQWLHTSFSKAEWQYLVLCLGLNEEDETALSASFNVATTGCWGGLPHDVSKQRCLRLMDKVLERKMNPHIRFRGCELAPNCPVTALLDITTTLVRYNPSSKGGVGHDFTSGHKGVCIKYQVTTTTQGTPIDIRGPWPGRRHDMHYFETPFDGFPVDVVLVDGGYYGLRSPALVPMRKPPRRELPAEAKLLNRAIGRYRGRVEHFFGQLKNRFRLAVSTKMGMETHGKFMRLILLCLHIVKHERNRAVGPAYGGKARDLPAVGRAKRDWRSDEPW